MRIPKEVEPQLGLYVYTYSDPATGEVFYVGKGQHGRVTSHLEAKGDSRKLARIKQIHSQGLEPNLDIIQHGIPNEDTAFRIEAALIDVLGLPSLTNEVHGWRYKLLGRVSLPELIAQYSKPVEISHPCILIRINRLYRPGMADQELYDITRGIWKVGPRRQRALFALSVYRSVVREVYSVHSWHPAGTTEYQYRTFEPAACKNRWEFVGSVATDQLREKYLLGNVSKYLNEGAQNPISYVGC